MPEKDEIEALRELVGKRPAESSVAFAIDVRNCARCGEDHKLVVFRRFTNPVITDLQTFSHWAPCPKTGEPILLSITKG